MAMFSSRVSRPRRISGRQFARTGMRIVAEGKTLRSANRRSWAIVGRVFAWVILLLPLTAVPALADYHLHRGDVLKISVLAFPQLHSRVMIDNDGKIYFPMVGEISVNGLSLAQLQQQLQDRLVSHGVKNPEVAVDVAEYRPVYVAGGAAKPGVYPYRPGMTVRDAIAVAGGYRREVLFDGISAQDQYNSLSIRFVRLAIHVARLRAELADKLDIDIKGLKVYGVPPLLLSEFLTMETQQLKTEQDNFSAEKGHLANLAKAAEEQVSALTEEQLQQRAELVQQQRDVARVRALFRRSLVQMVRVENEEKSIARWQTQFFDVQARAARARRSLEKYRMKLQQLSAQRKIELTQRLEKATGDLATVKVSLATASARMRSMEAGGPGRMQGAGEARSVVIFRNEHGHHMRIAANEDMTLAPGDTVAITESGAPAAIASSSPKEPPAPQQRANELHRSVRSHPKIKRPHRMVRKAAASD